MTSEFTVHRPLLVVPLALVLVIFYYAFKTVLATGTESPAALVVVFTLVLAGVICVAMGEE